jgi:prepilin-type N-terminal cleavage/methylation domain-containing protein
MKTRRSRGFTLIEALVSILILSVVMIVALTLLVSMRSFAAKQQAFTAPRQSARSAIDYLGFFLAGATDLNVEAGNPNALVMLTTFGVGAGTPRQASYNNLTAAEATAGYGDEGTDIISLAIATNPTRIPIVVPPPGPWTGNTASVGTAILNFSAGCGPAVDNDVVNMNLFKQVTGATAVGGTDVSGLLTVSDRLGRWRYLRITQYVSSACVQMTGTDPTREVITINFIPGDADQINPPGGWRNDLIDEPLTLNAGIEYTSFRVRNGALEQKTTGFDGSTPRIYSPGIFNPDCDGSTVGAGCPTIGFTPVVENVEDLQIAYVLRDGTIWNSLGTPVVKPGAIPGQIATGTAVPGATDISNVRALRVSVIARSNPLDIGARQLSGGPPPTAAPTPVADTRRVGLYQRPALEDHAEGNVDTTATGVFDRYRLTTTLVLRNRVLGF